MVDDVLMSTIESSSFAFWFASVPLGKSSSGKVAGTAHVDRIFLLAMCVAYEMRNGGPVYLQQDYAFLNVFCQTTLVVLKKAAVRLIESGWVKENEDGGLIPNKDHTPEMLPEESLLTEDPAAGGAVNRIWDCWIEATGRSADTPKTGTRIRSIIKALKANQNVSQGDFSGEALIMLAIESLRHEFRAKNWEYASDISTVLSPIRFSVLVDKELRRKKINLVEDKKDAEPYLIKPLLGEERSDDTVETIDEDFDEGYF